jgi:hypothetical protein
MSRYLPAVLLLLGLASTVAGNGIPVPRPRPAPVLKAGVNDVKLVIEIDNSVKTPRLVIPTALLLDFAGGAAPKKSAGLDVPTIVAGMALALSFTCGGLWLVRRGQARRAALVVGLASLVAFAGSVSADLLPKGPPKPVPVRLPASVRLPERLEMELVPRGDSMKLIVNSAMLPGPKE